jgi:hypothetical protein
MRHVLIVRDSKNTAMSRKIAAAADVYAISVNSI